MTVQKPVKRTLVAAGTLVGAAAALLLLSAAVVILVFLLGLWAAARIAGAAARMIP